MIILLLGALYWACLLFIEHRPDLALAFMGFVVIVDIAIIDIVEAIQKTAKDGVQNDQPK